MERSVSRAELEDREISASTSPESIALDQLNVFDEIEYIKPLAAQEQSNEVDEDVTAFRLFAPSQSGQAEDGVQTIRLKSPTPEDKEPGFLRPGRPHSYYFTPSETNSTFAQAAITGTDIQGLARIRWTGTALPWKVLELPASQVTRAAKQALLLSKAWSEFVPEDDVAKRRRPGKKARIKLRIKLAAAKSKALEIKTTQEAKDAAQREKKTRLNREKKAKKRQREKEKRAAARAEAGGDAQDAVMNEDDSDAGTG